jgi:hypothetical protein
MQSAIATQTIKQKGKMPVQMTTFLSWRDIFKLLQEFRHKIILNIIPPDVQQKFTPEEETVLLKNTGLYTDRFIKKNEKAKGDIKNTITCDSVRELQESLMSKK